MVQGYSNTDWQAKGITAEDSFEPTQLFTAEDEIKTSQGIYASGQQIAVLTILAYSADDELVPWNPGGSGNVTKPVAVAAADMNTSNTGGGTNADTYGPTYVGACFNPDLLVWPGSMSGYTYEEKKAALEIAQAPFRVKRLL
jgi:hypothetical protein